MWELTLALLLLTPLPNGELRAGKVTATSTGEDSNKARCESFAQAEIWRLTAAELPSPSGTTSVVFMIKGECNKVT